jgi:hypothetical protein
MKIITRIPTESMIPSRTNMSLVKFSPKQAASLVNRLASRGIRLDCVSYIEGGTKQLFHLNHGWPFIPHALFFDNGAEWDEINGIRDKANYHSNGIKRRASK